MTNIEKMDSLTESLVLFDCVLEESTCAALEGANFDAIDQFFKSDVKDAITDVKTAYSNLKKHRPEEALKLLSGKAEIFAKAKAKVMPLKNDNKFLGALTYIFITGTAVPASANGQQKVSFKLDPSLAKKYMKYKWLGRYHSDDAFKAGNINVRMIVSAFDFWIEYTNDLITIAKKQQAEGDK